jgi:PAS domain S-box-containing protein
LATIQEKELIRIQRDLAVALNGESDLDAALSLCFDTALKVSEMDAGGIYLFDSAGGLDLTVHRGHSDDFIEAVRYLKPGSSAVEMVHRGAPAYVRVDDLTDSVRGPFDREGFRSFAAIPVRHLGASIACMNLASWEHQELPEAIRHQLEGLAAILGGAIARLQAETSCRQSRTTLSALLDASSESAFLLDLNGVVLVANQTLAERLNTTVDELIGQPIANFVPPEAAACGRAHCEKAIATGELETRVEEWNGRYFHRRIQPIRDESGQIVLLAGFSAEITARRLAEQKILEEQHLLRELLDLQERERKLISHELHDGFVQDIVGAQMLLDAAISQTGANDSILYEEVDSAQRLLKQAIVEARRMIRDLRPITIPDDTGIVGALEDMAAQEQRSGELQIRFEHDVRFKRLEPTLEGTIFRIVHEALVNVRQHSESSTVTIRLTEPDDLLLEIEDHGIGFDVDQVSPDRFGVRGIRERARLFGGKATIQSRMGVGTKITVSLPTRQKKWAAH